MTVSKRQVGSRYSIRRLYLDHLADLHHEVGAERGQQVEEFMVLCKRHAWVLKIGCRDEDLPKNLLSAFSLRGLACWLSGAGKAYLFSDAMQLRELASARYFMSSTEGAFAQELRMFLDHQERDEFIVDTPRCKMVLGGPTLIMGILNVTPDSFFDGGKYTAQEQALAHGVKMVEEGADIIDIGGESTRPKGIYGEGAEPVSAEEEMARVLPIIQALSSVIDVPISIDTYKAAVAEAAIQAGAAMVNDVSGLSFDPKMAEVVAYHQVPLVVMHLKGTPQDMQQSPSYENLMDEVYLYLQAQVQTALQAGLPRELIIVDPGIGFGKRLSDNYELLRRLPELRGLGCPVLIGPSRKSFVGKPLNLPPEQRFEGTAAAAAVAAMKGAHILRVHDVAKIRRVAQITDLITGRIEPALSGITP
ncbi:MAG: dihydropteroate synthase [bacterium]